MFSLTRNEPCRDRRGHRDSRQKYDTTIRQNMRELIAPVARVGRISMRENGGAARRSTVESLLRVVHTLNIYINI